MGPTGHTLSSSDENGFNSSSGPEHHSSSSSYEAASTMSQFNFSDFTHFSLDDENPELTIGGLPPFPVRTLEQVVDPALLSVDPAEESSRGGSSIASLSRFSSAEGSSAQFASTGNLSPSGSKSPLQLGVDFIKNFSGDRKTTRDGQPAKRRGPKPDAKPALTRRQELNRQAQRSHRERKEQYIKALESEINHLRENYSHDLTESNSLRTELNILKEVLNEYGIPWEAELEQRKAARARKTGLSVPGSTSASTAASRSGSQTFHGQNISTPSASATSGLSPPHAQTPYMGQRGSLGSDRSGSLQPHGHPSSQYVTRSQPSQAPQIGSHDSGSVPPASHPQQSTELPQVMEMAKGIFEEDPALGIEFVLSLERPCQDHKPYLYKRSVDSPDSPEGAIFSGHALMASCPPPNRLVPVAGEEPYPHQTYDLPHADLEKLLNLSRQLVADGQLTPIEALSQLRNHNQYRSLTREDIKGMIEDLNRKVRCYGFGAVLEDFEVRDSLSGILATKVDSYSGFKDEDFVMEE